MAIAPTQGTRASNAGGVTEPSSRPAANIAKKPGPYVQFEAFVLQSFIQAILPQNATEVFGEGTAGEVWKSMLAEKMAMQMAEAGGVGIAKMIAPKASAPATDTAAASASAARSATAGRLLDLQLGAQGSGLAAPAPASDPAKTKI